MLTQFDYGWGVPGPANPYPALLASLALGEATRGHNAVTAPFPRCCSIL